jgi:SagB-type dehydrogenase family enzyme
MKKTDLNFQIIFGDPIRLYEKFHEATKTKKFLRQLPSEKWPVEWKAIHFKEYPRLPKVLLPEPYLDPGISLVETLYKRKSYRDFKKWKMSLEEISNLLYFTAGNKQGGKSYSANRFYPSGGSRYPLEVYLISVNSDLPKGLYHYNVKQHLLEQLLLKKDINFREYFSPEWFEDASIILITTAVFARTTIKYGDRGYRHIWHETGSLVQNIYLLSAALNLKCCPTGGFNDDRINKLLDIDGLRESVVSTVAVGK